MMAELTIVAGFGMLSAEKSIEIIRKVLQQLSVPVARFSLYGESIDLDQAIEVLKKADRSSFLLEGNDWQFHLSSMRHYSIDTLSVKSSWECLEANKWMNEFSSEFSIKQAWVADHEFDYWQNAEDPLQYTSKGRHFEHLPTRSNGLPPPLEQKVIDTSRNPGRRILRVGYVEVVGSPMWFGPEFWQITGKSKDGILSEPWVHPEVFQNNLLRIHPTDIPFSSLDAESIKMQNYLRSLLYPEQ